VGDPALYGKDRFFIDIRTEARTTLRMTTGWPHWKRPDIRVRIVIEKRSDHLGQDFSGSQMATAVAGAILAITPSTSPTSEDAKIKTRELTAAFEKSGALPPKTRDVHRAGRSLHRRPQCPGPAQAGADGDTARGERICHVPARTIMCAARLYRAQSRAYREPAAHALEVRDKRMSRPAPSSATLLHSTGQATRAARTAGYFCRSPPMDARDLAVPGQQGHVLRVIKAAQARGAISTC